MNASLSAFITRLRSVQARLELLLLRAAPVLLPGVAPGPRAATPSPASILVLLPDEIGDMVLALPLLRGLRRRHPAAGLWVLAQAVPGSLALSLGLADGLAPLRGGRPFLPVLQAAWRSWRAFRPLRGRAFDWVLYPRSGPDYRQAGLLAARVPGAFRAGFAASASPGKAAWERVPAGFWGLALEPRSTHEAGRLEEFMAALGLPAPGPGDRRVSDPGSRRRAAARLAAFGPGPWLAVAPFARSRRRAWPLGRWEPLVAGLARARGLKPFVLAGPGEGDAARALASLLGPGTPVFAGLPLRDAASLLARARLFAGADSAFAHLAAAEGRPCLVVGCHPAGAPALHANAPERFAPWGVDALVLRPPRHAWPCVHGCDAFEPHCILELDVGRALAGAADWPRPPAPARGSRRFPGPRGTVKVLRKGAKP